MSAPTVRVKREAMLGGLVCHVAEDFERRFKTSALVELVGGGSSENECFARAMAWVEGTARGMTMQAPGGMKGLSTT